MTSNIDNNYKSYMRFNGQMLNQEVKNNIRFRKENLLVSQLVDYIHDTYINYDHRFCPDYEPDETPIGPEEKHTQIFISENGRILSSEKGDTFISELSFTEDYYGELLVFIEEYNDKYFAVEGDANKYEFDKAFLRECLTRIMNLPVCPL